MIMRKNIICLQGIILLAILPGILLATKYKKTSINRLIKTSPVIVEGKIESKKSYWLNGKIYTDFNVSVTEQYKGTNKRIISFRILGGRVANKALTIYGLPDIQVGETALLFLVVHKGKYTLNSLGMGYFKLSDKSEKTYYNSSVSNKILISDSTGSKNDQNPQIKKSVLIKKIASSRE